MAQFTQVTSRVIPLPNRNVDTDQIIPARFLKVTDKSGLGEALFSDWRYNADGSEKSDFVLNHSIIRELKFCLPATILAADPRVNTHPGHSQVGDSAL